MWPSPATAARDALRIEFSTKQEGPDMDFQQKIKYSLEGRHIFPSKCSGFRFVEVTTLCSFLGKKENRIGVELPWNHCLSLPFKYMHIITLYHIINTVIKPVRTFINLKPSMQPQWEIWTTQVTSDYIYIYIKRIKNMIAVKFGFIWTSRRTPKLMMSQPNQTPVWP